ncbi:SDR family NAD(P)-dependent oxidoreductase [Nonomuraea sp. NPDC050536]|uniref:SDR family NAD(P)-dependent oxidoreductase n=1 Tax=Nonomuraea sp. NPDC050536 TaxID=3364366 RepID=UPI0037CBD9B6
MGDLLVTGAAGGIGSAVVSALEAAGHQVTALGRSLERLPGSARRIEADLSRPETLEAALGDLGDLDGVIHCAGVAHVAPVAEASVEVWTRTLAVNLASAAEITRLALPALRRSRGHVVFVNATPGMHAVPRWSAFVGSKTALRELADSLREEEEPHGVRVTTVYPAATATDHLRAIRAAFGRPYDPAACIQPASLAAMIVWLLAAPADSYPCELSVIPAPRSS